MPLSPRITLPISAALLCAIAAGGFLFWQLDSTRAMLSAGIQKPTGTGAATVPQTTPLAAIDTGNESLLRLRQGDVFALRGEWKNAQEEYQKSVDAGGGLTALRKLAQAQMQRRDIRGAQTTLDQLRRSGAKKEDTLLLESIIDLRTGELGKALTLLNASEDSPQKHYGLALVGIITGDTETARKELALVETGWEPVLRTYARTLQKAYEEFALFPESPELHLLTLLGHALADVQECELALPLLSEATNQQDDYRDAWILQGFCELTTERLTEALASLERAYQLDPEKPETQYFLGRVYSAQEDHGNALTFLQYALENGFQPEAEARRLIAKEALITGNVTLALDQQDALTRLPDAGLQSYSDYIAAALTSDKKQEAQVKAEEAVVKWPNDAVAYMLLGWVQAENGNTAEARSNLEKALSMNPELTSARERLNKL